MFNVKVYRYPSGTQIRMYDSPISHGLIKKEEKPLPYDWVYDIDPFSLEYEYFKVYIEDLPDCKDLEKKAEHSRYNSFMRTKNMVYSLARSHVWEWFVTFTFDPLKVDSFDYSEVTKKLSKWLNNARLNCPDMKYIVVPELHKSGRFHFHGLFSGIDDMRLESSGHYDNKGNEVYNIGSYKLGFTTATRVNSLEKVVMYISKYITKELCGVTANKKRYWHSKNLVAVEPVEMYFEDLKVLLDTIAPYSLHMKKVIGADQTTTYIEVGKDFDI